MNKITFQSTFINDTKIIKNPYSKQKAERKASFVEIDPCSKKDIDTFNTLHQLWGTKSQFVSEILYDLKHDYNCEDNSGKRKYFALTLQKDKFENLSPYDILGVAQLEKFENEHILEYIEVNPSYKSSMPERLYKNIGTGILDSIKKLKDIECIKVYSLANTISFYKQAAFKQMHEGALTLIWKKPH